VALVLGMLVLGTASIGAAVGGAALSPAASSAALAAQAMPGRASATSPEPHASGPWSAAGTFLTTEVRPAGMCHSSAAVADLAAVSRASTSPTAGTVRAAQRHAVDTPPTQAVAAFLGDSYTTGYNGAGLGPAGWPAIVSASIHLRLLNRAVAGTGFINPGWTAQPIRTRVAAVVAANPRIVFLVGGHNDRRFAGAATDRAADVVIDRLHRALPDTILVVVGPIWSNGDPPLSLRRLRDHLRRKAAAVRALFIDPLDGGWFAGSAGRLIGPDGIHPTDAGHRHIAHLVLRALQADRRFQTTPGRGAATSAMPPSTVVATASPLAGQPVACRS